MPKRGRIFIGTSGWAYKHWEDIFFPRGLPERKKLEYLAGHFNTVEVNYSFYRLPQIKTFAEWKERTPPGFVFAVKASRYLTHVKRLKNAESSWQLFLGRAQGLGKKMGPVLLQFPPSFKFKQENFERIKIFLKCAKKAHKKIKLAFEFRDEPWNNDEVLKYFKKNNAAFVMADSPSFRLHETVSANFIYIRMHGGESLYSSKYSRKELKDLARKVKIWSGRGLDVFVYFNNDARGYAIENARELMGFLGK